jgi:hypothetical protein
MVKEGTKSGLPFQVKMTGTTATEIAQLDHTLRTMQSTSPESLKRFVELLRKSVEAQA